MTNINIPETDRVAHTNPTFSNIKEWLGIPYATADRFQSPEMVDFNTNLDYSKSGPASLQPFDAATLQSDKGLSENCLNLSIWAPKRLKSHCQLSFTITVVDLSMVQIHKSPRYHLD